jgi:hypothetical protein
MSNLIRKLISVSFIWALCVSVIQNPSYATVDSLEQWAVSAEASSSYLEYEPEYATGAPDATACDLKFESWSPSTSNVGSWLVTTFESAIYPEEINIYQNNIQGVISKVEVSADGVAWQVVYLGEVNQSDGVCKTMNTTVFDDVFTLDSNNADWPDVAVNKVKITLDQTGNPSNDEDYVDIDAVQLVGRFNLQASATVKPYISAGSVSSQSGATKLTANKGTWIGTPDPTFSYKWYACKTKVKQVKQTIPSNCKAIAGATKKTLRVKKAMKGKFIAVKVTGTSEGTEPTWYLSKSTAIVK